jgi:hypothetical protein
LWMDGQTNCNKKKVLILIHCMCENAIVTGVK